MAKELIERFAKERGISFEDALKQIEFLMNYMPRKGKDTAATASW